MSVSVSSSSLVVYIYKQVLIVTLSAHFFHPQCGYDIQLTCWTVWWLLGWFSAKLPSIRSKMRLQHNSSPFLPPASRFSALPLGHAQKSKFWDSFWTREWPPCTSLGFPIFAIFFACPFSPFLLFLLQWLSFYWACLRLNHFWESILDTGNF